MSKRQFAVLAAMMVCFSLLSAALSAAAAVPPDAQANVDHLQQTTAQTTAEPTIDAAVATIFAQTQQADGGDMTQAVATAFSAAQTATAQGQATVGEMPTTAEATPEAPVPTLDVSTLNAEIVQTYDLTAGPANTSAYLAPDGEKFAYVDGAKICLYTLEGEKQHCSELGDEARDLDRESVSWSRDSRYVAFALQALIYFIDSDIWVYDTVENRLVNVTPDEQGRLEIGELDSGTLQLDLSPRWTDDGRLWFIRLNSRNLGAVFSADADGENLTRVYSFISVNPFQFYLLDVTHDGSAIALTGYTPGNDGLVLYENLVDDTTRSIRLPDEFGVVMLTFSPDGQYLLLVDGRALGQFDLNTSVMHVLDVTTSRIRPVDAGRITQAAGWLPDQNALVYSVFDVEIGNEGLYLTRAPGEPGEQLVDGLYTSTTSRQYQPIWVSVQNSFLVTQRGGDYLLNLISLE